MVPREVLASWMVGTMVLADAVDFGAIEPVAVFNSAEDAIFVDPSGPVIEEEVVSAADAESEPCNGRKRRPCVDLPFPEDTAVLVD